MRLPYWATSQGTVLPRIKFQCSDWTKLPEGSDEYKAMCWILNSCSALAGKHSLFNTLLPHQQPVSPLTKPRSNYKIENLQSFFLLSCSLARRLARLRKIIWPFFNCELPQQVLIFCVDASLGVSLQQTNVGASTKALHPGRGYQTLSPRETFSTLINETSQNSTHSRIHMKT